MKYDLEQTMKELIFIPKEELIKALLNKQQEVLQIKEQLKQRNKIISDSIKMLDKLDNDIMQNTIIGFNQFLPRFYVIKEYLQKYKGDNNE